MLGSNGRLISVSSGGSKNLGRLYSGNIRNLVNYSVTQIAPYTSTSFTINAAFVEVHSDYNISLKNGDIYEVTVPYICYSPETVAVPVLCKRIENYDTQTWTFQIITKKHAEQNCNQCDETYINQPKEYGGTYNYIPVQMTIGENLEVTPMDRLYLVYFASGQPNTSGPTGLYATPCFGWMMYGYNYRWNNMCWYGMSNVTNAIGYDADGFDCGTKVYQCFDSTGEERDGIVLNYYGGSPSGPTIATSSTSTLSWYGCPCVNVCKVDT